MPLLDPAKALLLVVNAREADGRDTSWLWDVPFERLDAPVVVACGERAADLGVRLSYAEVEHVTTSDPLSALDLLRGRSTSWAPSVTDTAVEERGRGLDTLRLTATS